MRPTRGTVRSRPVLNGLHHIYERAAWPDRGFAARQRHGSVTVQHKVLAEAGDLVIVAHQVGFEGGVFSWWTPERQVRLGDNDDVDRDLVQSRDHAVQLRRRGGPRVEMGESCLVASIGKNVYQRRRWIHED